MNETLAGNDGHEEVARFVQLLAVEPLGGDRFRAWNPPHPKDHVQQSLFGGQVAAHSLRAAQLTVEVDHHIHSLHGYFLRPGKDDAPTDLHVERIRDGKSFTTRTVVAYQGDEAIFNLTASFHRDEPGGDFATPIAPDLPLPDELMDEHPPRFDRMGVDSPFERIDIPGFSFRDRNETPRRAMWIRLRSPLPDDPALQACAVTFISDMGVLGAVRTTRGQMRKAAMAASLDHAVWFHRPVRADEWLLYDIHAKSTAGSRGLGIGTLHTADGTHAVTVGQEGLVRLLG
ncbi:MAG TPA: acyl-CoA thioesterase domain-containing protein [Mycobacteriales bacterium]|nr:acyl-CoA thioesterase domain-containing protein [Mycobacteriales bacterium]